MKLIASMVVLFGMAGSACAGMDNGNAFGMTLSAVTDSASQLQIPEVMNKSAAAPQETRFKSLVKMYDSIKTPAPAQAEVTGSFLGWCYRSRTPNTSESFSLLGKEIATTPDNGPLFPQSPKEFQLTLERNNGTIGQDVWDGETARVVDRSLASKHDALDYRVRRYVAETGENYFIAKIVILKSYDDQKPGETNAMCYFPDKTDGEGQSSSGGATYYSSQKRN
jgi:hypothetical protein